MHSAVSQRRAFLKLCGACAAFLTGADRRSAVAAPQPARGATRHRKNFVAIQVKPYAWVDEGIDQLLDNIQHKGEVNTVWAYTYDYSEARMTPNGTIPLPDHGSAGELPISRAARSTTTTPSTSATPL